MTVATLSGSCLCGAVRYSVDDAFRYAAICHCSQCRRATGSANKPFAGIERDRLRLTAGETGLLIWGDPTQSHDVHCNRCGSLLYSVLRENQWVHVALGTLIDTPSIRPTEHIFAGSKAAWETITDDLPQHEGFAE